MRPLAERVDWQTLGRQIDLALRQRQHACREAVECRWWQWRRRRAAEGYARYWTRVLAHYRDEYAAALREGRAR